MRSVATQYVSSPARARTARCPSTRCSNQAAHAGSDCCNFPSSRFLSSVLVLPRAAKAIKVSNASCSSSASRTSPRGDVTQYAFEAFEIQSLRENVFHHFADQGMRGDGDVALNIFLASKSFGKDRSQQIVSAHALDPWRNFLPPRNRSKASARPASRRAVKSGEASTACSRTVRTEFGWRK